MQFEAKYHLSGCDDYRYVMLATSRYHQVPTPLSRRLIIIRGPNSICTNVHIHIFKLKIIFLQAGL